MRAVEISHYGGPEVLKAVVRPDLVLPLPGSGEVLIRVRAAGVNRPDVLQRQGFYPVPPGGTDLPGLEENMAELPLTFENRKPSVIRHCNWTEDLRLYTEIENRA